MRDYSTRSTRFQRFFSKRNLTKTKTLIWLIPLCILLMGTAAKVAIPKTQDTQQFLFEAGFKNIPNFIGKNNLHVKYWNDKYGVQFVTHVEMDTLLKANEFMVGAAEDYIDIIPEKSAEEIRRNYSKIEDELLTYIITDHTRSKAYAFSHDEVGWDFKGEMHDECSFGRMFKPERISFYVSDKAMTEMGMSETERWELTRDMENAKIRIVAPISKFKPGAKPVHGLQITPVKPPNPDPIAVVPHRYGWIILAKW